MAEIEIIGKLRNVKSMPELDGMRLDTVRAMQDGGDKEKFARIQNAFRKAKNRLERIPLRNRNW